MTSVGTFVGTKEARTKTFFFFLEIETNTPTFNKWQMKQINRKNKIKLIHQQLFIFYLKQMNKIRNKKLLSKT